MKDEIELKLIEHLSKEVETHTNNLMTFRARVSFAALVGPFILLGLVAAKRISGYSNGKAIAGGLGVMALCYLAIGVAAGRIERHVWRQCNAWRSLIAEIARGTEGITAQQLEFSERLLMAYFIIYSAMILAFGSAITIIMNLNLAPQP